VVTLEDIQERTGVSVNTIQYWRRPRNEGLLPEPAAVRKKVIYFDDSIIERVKFIRKKLKDGLKLPEIKKLLRQKDEKERHRRPGPDAIHYDTAEQRLEAAAELEKKWTSGNCKNEVCLALSLDPTISGYPLASIFSAVWSLESPMEICVSIISNGWVHFAKIQVHLGGRTGVEVVERAKIKVPDFGMLLALIGQKLAEDNQLLSVEDIPGLLFGCFDLDGWSNAFSPDTLEEAKKLTRILRAGQEFVRHL
jgi:DNA-binding transcriptional MerR regulator